MTSAYENLKARFAQIKNLDAAGQILNRDMETVMAPGSAQDREQQLVAIGSASHVLISDPRVEGWLNDAEGQSADLSPDDRRNLSLMRRQWIHKAGISTALADARALVEAKGTNMHIANYKGGDWSTMKDWYKHSFDIMREVGEAKKDALGVPSVYDALLDEFSPGLRADHINREFAALDQSLRVMIPAAFEYQKTQTAPLPLNGPFKIQAQMKLNTALAKAVGFDFERGVLQLINGHPASCGSSDDSRITTRAGENDFLESLYSTVHEVGHSMYEQNQPAAWRYQPAGGHLGMAVHESQSMIIELQACMSREFLDFLAVKLQKTFNRSSDPSLTAENLQRHLWRASPSFIRVNADELTYPMHVLLRHDLESRIIDRTLDVADLPDAWNDGLKQRLGIVPPNPAQGCMQDVHWPTGSIGYFPAYTLGAMGAAQFFAAASKADAKLLPALSKGNFKPLKNWLVKNVHSKGSLVDANELFVQATGSPLSAKPYLDHLGRRYLGQNL